MLSLEERRRKRTPVVSKPELATTALVEPEIAGSQNPVAPAHDPVTSSGAQEAPLIATDEPQMSDYQWNQRLYDGLFQKPMSQEEEERRKRAASVATGIGHLGNVLSSFSNLAFAGEAPSQTLPTVPDPKLRSYSDRMEAIRQRYGAGYLAARQNDMNNYQRALSLYRQDKTRKEDLAIKEKALERQAALDAWNKDKWQREYDSDQDYKKWKQDLENEKLKLDKREIENREKSGYYTGRSGRRSSVSSNNNGTIVLDTPDGFMDIDMSKVNLSTLSQIFNSLPDSIKDNRNYRVSSKDGEKDRQAKYMAAIGEAAKADPRVADYLYRSGLGKLREGTKSEIIDWSPSLQQQDINTDGEDIIDYTPASPVAQAGQPTLPPFDINKLADEITSSEAKKRKEKLEAFDRLIARGGINKPFYNEKESIKKI